MQPTGQPRPAYNVQPGMGGPTGAPGAHHGGQGQAGASHEADVLRNLMINYIPTQVDEAYLRQMFEAYGPVESVKIVYDKENNMSKGYGFVKYRSPQSASLAINNLNAYPILNKRLKVAYAKPEDAQRMLQQMSGGDAGAGAMGQAGGNMDPQQMQYMYYMQLQAQQLWLQQMQQQMAGGTPGAQPGTASSPMTPQQQQMMMMVQQQQAAAAAGAPGAQQH